ncbi:hypothetical protein C8R44DRAFT_141366 [Mycena epipterygia]|nr:hypothetical protein C8R44DRAFT_141366 [Mycena epipterygia]
MEENTLPSLPLELERVIFELAAWNYPETITIIILVARRVCIWIEPLLYHVVISSGSPERLLQMMQSKPPEFLREHVHHLALSSKLFRSDVERILSTCTNIHDLALWTGDTYPGLLSKISHPTALRRLSVNLFGLFGGIEDDDVLIGNEDDNLLGAGDKYEVLRFGGLSSFAHLTHLDVFSSLPEFLWPVFGTLPCLTHLSFTDFYFPELIQQTLDTCAVLELVVIIWMQDADPTEETPEITDPRFCTISCLQFENDWELGAWGGLDVWRRAEEVVARKRRAIEESPPQN